MGSDHFRTQEVQMLIREVSRTARRDNLSLNFSIARGTGKMGHGFRKYINAYVFDLRMTRNDALRRFISGTIHITAKV